MLQRMSPARGVCCVMPHMICVCVCVCVCVVCRECLCMFSMYV